MSGLPDYRLALATRGTGAGLGTPISGMTDILDTIGVAADSSLRWTEVLNGYGTLELELPIDHSLVTRANFAVGQRELHLYRNDGSGETLVWAGRLWLAHQEDWFVRLTGYSWYFDLTRREVEDDYASRPSAPKDQYKIVHDLTQFTQGLGTNPWPAVAGRELGIREYADYGSVTSGVTRNMAVCAEERRKISDVIEELAAARDGLDFVISPAKVLRLYSPRKGTATAVTLSGADNTSSISYDEDATEVASQVAGVGDIADCSAANVYVTSDATSLTAFGLLQETTSPEDKRNNQNLIQKVADEWLVAHSVSRQQPAVEYGKGLQDVAASPVLLSSYEVGDSLTINMAKGAPGGFGYINQVFRVIEREVTVDVFDETIVPTLDHYVVP